MSDGEGTLEMRTLRAAKIVLLVDWPSGAVARALLEAGLEVFGYSPAGYSKAEIVEGPVTNGEKSMSVFPPEGDEKGYLVFRRLEGTPERVDMVAIFRPEKETAGILEKHVLPLKAKAVWFLRSVDSEEERELVARSGIRVIENADIVAVARIIAREKRSGG